MLKLPHKVIHNTSMFFPHMKNLMKEELPGVLKERKKLKKEQFVSVLKAQSWKEKDKIC